MKMKRNFIILFQVMRSKLENSQVVFVTPLLGTLYRSPDIQSTKVPNKHLGTRTAGILHFEGLKRFFGRGAKLSPLSPLLPRSLPRNKIKGHSQ